MERKLHFSFPRSDDIGIEDKTKKNVMKRTVLMMFLSLVVGLGQSVSGKEAPLSERQLLSDVEAAFKAKDKDALIALVNWEGVSDKFRASQIEMLSGMVKQEIKEMKLSPLPADFKPEIEVNGVLYRKNVSPSGMVEFKFAQNVNGIAGSSLLYGKKGNAFYVASIIEEKLANPMAKEKSLSVMVMGTTAPEVVVFEGFYIYLKGGKEIIQVMAIGARCLLETISSVAKFARNQERDG